MTLVNDKAASSPLTKGAAVDLVIDKLAFGGQALGRVDGFVVFVDQAAPGQKVRVEITRKKKQFAEARVVQLLEESHTAVPPFCRHFGLCGGCQWQHLTYGEQLRWKGLHVEECLEHLGGLAPLKILPPVASPEERYYRNKMEFTFAPRVWVPAGEFIPGTITAGAGCALGLHVRGYFNRVFDLTECFLQSPQTAALVQTVRQWCRDSGLPAYTTRDHQGFWRFLVIREGKRTGQTLVHLITSGQGDPAAVEALGASLREEYPGITSLVHSVSAKKAQVAVGEVSRTLWGPGYIEERLGELTLRVSVKTFLQTNTLAAEGLYEAIARLGQFTGRETVWDLYCGAGSIALYLAPLVRQVVGFELVPEAVADAYVNCRLNGIDNCRFVAGDLKDQVREAIRGSGGQDRPDVVITDPPRAGLHPQVVEALIELAPGKIIMVSCNPATLARDLALLQDHFEIRTIQPFDLFPHTAHIESLALLELRPSLPV